MIVDVYRRETRKADRGFPGGVVFDFLPTFPEDQPFAAISVPESAEIDDTESRGLVLRFPGFEAGVTAHHAYHMAVAGLGGLSVAS